MFNSLIDHLGFRTPPRHQPAEEPLGVGAVYGQEVVGDQELAQECPGVWRGYCRVAVDKLGREQIRELAVDSDILENIVTRKKNITPCSFIPNSG